MEIKMVSRPYDKMRYPTVGDYLYDLRNDRFSFIIAEMQTDCQALIFLHEFLESYLCWKAGIPENDITLFDKKFERERSLALHGKDDEPGDDKFAPYFKQHQIATKFEKMFCKELGMKWKDYSKEIENVIS